MNTTPLLIEPLTLSDAVVGELSAMLVEVVAGDGSVGFMHPLPEAEAAAFWRAALVDAGAGGRIVLGARRSGKIVGTVTLALGMPKNQPHRAEVWKLLVAPSARRAGVAEALMREVETLARNLGRTLLNLDTVHQGDAFRLYGRLGWTRVGEIPGYALTPHGAMAATSIFFKQL